MKTKLYVISAVILAALGFSLFLSPPAQAAPICGDTDFTGPCVAKPPGCGDKTFNGPCAPIDYKALNCASLTSYEGPSRCNSVKKCMADRGATQAACLQEWTACRDKVSNPQGTMKSGDREGCMNSVATGVAYTPAAPIDENKTSCAVEGIGWIICPVMRFLAQLVDQAYGIVSRLLAVPAIDTSTNSDMYKAWSTMRNFANVAFVMAFLFIIYSQITSVGITNYGVKKMLPRLIVAAVLVNVSYWVCAIAVDLSNIAGVSFKGLLEGAANQLYKPVGGVEGGAGGKWDAITVGVLAGGVAAIALYATLSALLPLLIAAAVAVASAVLVLTLRQALIIILIVVSPLAFVAYLLPNTASIFSKWRAVFQTLLLIYPILGIVFGGSALAATIITNSAGGDLLLQSVGAGVTVLPLFTTLAILATINAALSGLGLNVPKISADGLKKRAEGYRDKRKNIAQTRRLGGTNMFREGQKRVRGDGSSRFRRVAAKTIGAAIAPGSAAATRMAVGGLTRDQQEANAQHALSEAKQDYIVGRVGGGDEKYAQKLAGPTGDVSKVRAAAKAAQTKEFIEKVNAEKATMSRSAPADLHAVMKDTAVSEERRSAAAGQLMKVGSDEDIHKALDYAGTQAKNADGSFVDGAMASVQQQMGTDLGNRKPLALGSGDVADLNKGSYDGDFDGKIAYRLGKGKVSAEDLAGASNDEFKRINDFMKSPKAAALKANPEAAAAFAKLETDIAAFRDPKNPSTSGRQPAPEIAAKMDELHGLL